MTFSPEANNSFTTFLRAWTSREDLRHSDASPVEILDATIAIDEARRALRQPERYPLAA